MSDLFDQASEIETLFRDKAIEAARAPQRAPSTSCRNCDEPLTDRVNFCDTDCQADYERRTGSRHRTMKVTDDD